MPWSKRRTWLLVLIALAASSVVAALLLVGYSCSNPSDRVMVEIRNVPEGTVLVECVAYESDGVWRKMYWYHTMLLRPMPWDPATYPLSSSDPHNPDVPWGERATQWRPSGRYAVATVTADETLWITALDAEDVKIEGASSLTGGGRATFDLSKGRTVPMTAETKRDLELWGRVKGDSSK